MIAIGNAEGRIAVGMLAKVYLPVGDPVEAVIVPKDAVVTKGRESSVYRIKVDNTVEKIPVEIGSSLGVWVAVKGAVSAGDKLITRGNERVFPGQLVEVEHQDYPLP